MLTSNQVDVSRQVVLVMDRILSAKGKLGAIALRNGQNKTRFPEAKVTKRERKEYHKKAVKVLFGAGVALGYFDATDKAITIDTTNLLVGDICEIQTGTYKSKGDLTIIITEITNGSSAKARKVGGTDVAITTTDYLFVKSNANPEASDNKNGRPLHLPTTRYNYTQIMTVYKDISGTAYVADNYDINSAKAELRTQAYDEMAELLDGLTTSGVRAIMNIAGKDHRIAGGLKYFAKKKFLANGEETAGNNGNVLNKGGAALAIEDLYAGFKYAVENGGTLNAIICSPTQALAISGLEQNKINISLVNASNAGTIGGAVQVLKSPISVQGNQINAIYVDNKMETDAIVMFNENNLGLVPMTQRGVLETFMVPKQEGNTKDAAFIDLLGEWTVDYMNAAENTYIIEDLAV